MWLVPGSNTPGLEAVGGFVFPFDGFFDFRIEFGDFLVSVCVFDDGGISLVTPFTGGAVQYGFGLGGFPVVFSAEDGREVGTGVGLWPEGDFTPGCEGGRVESFGADTDGESERILLLNFVFPFLSFWILADVFGDVNAGKLSVFMTHIFRALLEDPGDFLNGRLGSLRGEDFDGAFGAELDYGLPELAVKRVFFGFKEGSKGLGKGEAGGKILRRGVVDKTADAFGLEAHDLEHAGLMVDEDIEPGGSDTFGGGGRGRDHTNGIGRGGIVVVSFIH